MQDITPLPIARADSPAERGYGSVPVKKPVVSASLTQQVDNPISTDARTLAQFASEAEMDKILEDINKKVQAGNTEQAGKKGLFSFLRRSEKKPNPSPAQPVSKTENAKQPPVVPAKKRRFIPAAAIAVIVGIALCAFAFAAFAKQNEEPAGDQSRSPSNSAQSNSSVTTEDVDKLSSDVKDKIESLSEQEDWSPEGLSDSALGL